MHTILSVIVVAILAFLGTMFDNFFAFSAQLIVTDETRVRRVSYAQALGAATLHADSPAVGRPSVSGALGPGVARVAPPYKGTE